MGACTRTIRDPQPGRRRGHRAYLRYSEESIRSRAASVLPEDNFFPDLVVELPLEGSRRTGLDPQKAATPAEGRVEDAADVLRDCRPSAVVDERSGLAAADFNAGQVASLRHVSAQLASKTWSMSSAVGTETSAALFQAAAPDSAEGRTEPCDPSSNLSPDDAAAPGVFVARTGSELVDAFDPWFFGVAFAFCFPYCVGLPDPPACFEKEAEIPEENYEAHPWYRPRYRRTGPGTPRVEPLRWCRAVARRVEAQFRRDWTLGFGLWNFMFRNLLNLRRTLRAFGRRYGAGPADFTAEKIEEAAAALVEGLTAKYRDPGGYLRPVHGDLAKLR